MQCADSNDGHGWHILLGDHLAGRVLCVDLTSVATSHFLRALGGDVHSIDLSTADSTEAPEYMMKRLCRALESDTLSRYGESSFDAFLLHDLEGVALHADDEDCLYQLMKTVNRLLKADGVCYLGFRNADVLFSRAANRKRERKLLRPSMLRSALVCAGFPSSQTRMYPYTLTEGRVLEILPDRGYTSVKNSRLWREQIKEICYGRFGAKRWAPAYGVVTTKGALRVTRIEQIASRLQELSARSMVESAHMEMMRCQLLWRKVILSYGSGKEKYGSVVVVYTADKQAIARREVEADVLKKLALRVPALRDKLPRAIATGHIDRYRYFVLSEFPGMTIDRPCQGTALATRSAANFLSALHLATAENYGGFQAIAGDPIGGLFEEAINRYPPLASEIAQVADAVRHRKTDQAWLTVWQHGDFKLENVVIDPRSLSVVGVIDWELAQECGLPLLDLLYLIAYNRSVNESLHITDVYLETILPWKFSSEETQILDDYQNALGFTVTDVTLCATLYMIHEIGIRFLYDLAVPEHRKRLEHLLRATASALQSVAVSQKTNSRSTTTHSEPS